MTCKKPWRKVLYENQDYPDNYTDKNIFLRDLRKNVHFKELPKKEAIYGANLLLQELCTVVIFVLMYFYLTNGLIEPSIVLNSTSIFTIVGYFLYRTLLCDSVPNDLGDDLRTVLTFLVFGQLFSPILHTLTDTISTDTIYTATFFMMLVHLIFFDYGVSAAIVSNSISLSAAVFASICLASRLPSAYHAFIFMTVATEVFVLFPLLRKKIGNSILLSGVLLFCDIYFLYRISLLVTTLFVFTVLFIVVICPLLFVNYQKYKDNIYGPWDEAIVDDMDNVTNL